MSDKSPSRRVTKVKLQQRITELEAKLVGTEQSLKLVNHDFDEACRTASRWQQQADKLLKQCEEFRKTKDQLLKDAEVREASSLSDVEIAALTAEVQAQLAQVPVTDARRRLQAALQSRRVLPQQATMNPIAWEKKVGTGAEEGWEPISNSIDPHGGTPNLESNSVRPIVGRGSVQCRGVEAASTDDHTVRVYRFRDQSFETIYRRISDGLLMKRQQNGIGGWYAVNVYGERVGETFAHPWQVKIREGVCIATASSKIP